MLHEVLGMYFSDSKLVTRSKRQHSIQKTSRNSNKRYTCQINQDRRMYFQSLTVQVSLNHGNKHSI